MREGNKCNRAKAGKLGSRRPRLARLAIAARLDARMKIHERTANVELGFFARPAFQLAYIGLATTRLLGDFTLREARSFKVADQQFPIHGHQ